MVFRPHLRSLGRKPIRPIVSALVLGLMLSVTILNQPAQAQAGNRPDLGDAPASVNNFGVGMQWHPASPFNAQFPTVFFAGAQPTGPKHFNAPTVYFLGNSGTGGTITCENQADVGADCDGPNNINPPANTPNQDLGDDGPVWGTLGAIPGCMPKQYTYFVTSLAAVTTTAYVNSWYDFNQNGVWGNAFACGGLNVNEWIVVNQPITIAPGVNVFTTPVFNAAPNPSNYPRWVRISLSDTPLAITPAARRGSGPAQGWKLGETEDYRLPN